MTVLMVVNKKLLLALNSAMNKNSAKVCAKEMVLPV
jgi:hypothetical protein